MKQTLRMTLRSIWLLILLFVFSAPAVGQDSLVYKLSWKTERAILGASSGLTGIGLIIDNGRGPITEAEIKSLNSENIWTFDRSATNFYSDGAAAASDIFKNGVFLAPFALFLSGKARSEYRPILLMSFEVLALNGALTKATKEASGRFRPYAYNASTPLEVKLSKTTRRSFFSGHVSHVASLSFFTARVFSDLYPDSNYKYAVWAGAITAPALAGYYRYKAGRHYPSDIIVGYGVGALVGYFIPKLHKRKGSSDLSIYGTGNGLGLSYSLK